METVDRLKSEKEDLEQEMRDLSTRNELLRANNEVQGSSLAASDVDIDDGGDGGNYYAMYEEMKSSYDRLLGQKEKLGREYHAAIEELVRKKIFQRVSIVRQVAAPALVVIGCCLVLLKRKKFTVLKVPYCLLTTFSKHHE